MKWLLLFIFVIVAPILVISLLIMQKSETKETLSPVIAPTDTPLPTTSPTITPALNTTLRTIDVQYGTQSFKMYAREIPRTNTLELIPNFTTKVNGEKLIEEHNCSAAVNGGFYQKNGEPLGLFSVKGKQYGTRIDSSLVTGFFWEYTTGERYIAQEQPTTASHVNFILQAGPYMKVGSGKLTMSSDEQARRSLLGVDSNNILYMISISDKENSFSGPYLGDVPDIFFQKDIQKYIPFTTLLNLDGGSASYFFVKTQNERISLNEITTIGSILCLK